MSLDTADWSLLISALGLSMVVGAGLFQALFVMPEYFSNPPATLRRYQQDRSYMTRATWAFSALMLRSA